MQQTQAKEQKFFGSFFQKRTFFLQAPTQADFLLTLYRSLTRQGLYTALNVFGLAIGIAVCLVLGLIVQYESSFNSWMPNANLTYRIDTIWRFPGEEPREGADSSFVVLPLLLADSNRIEAGTRMMPRSHPVIVGNTIDTEDVGYTDPNFLDVIGVKLLEGDRAQALSSPTKVVISRATAEKYFGTVRALGRTLTISEDGKQRSFTVSAIMENIPGNSTLEKLPLLTPLTPAVEQDVQAFKRWGSSSGETFLRFRTASDAASVASGLRDFVARRAAGAGNNQEGTHPENHLALSLVSFADAHFHDLNVENTAVPGSDRRVVASLGAIGGLALLLAAINYINLATARAGLRAREVALRKVMGATRRLLLVQFLGEAIALSLFAGLIGLALAELAVPIVNALGGWAMRIDYAEIVPLLVALGVVLGLGAGAYPALLLASYRPALVLAAARTPGGGRMGTRLRNLLVLMQFAGAIGFAICTCVIDRQAAFLRNADRGFRQDGLIIVKSLSAQELLARQNVILDALRQVPGVISVTSSNREPDSEDTEATDVGRAGLAQTNRHFISEIVGRDYFRTYDIRLLSGRVFDDAHPSDDMKGDFGADRTLATVINARAASALGFATPEAAIGQTMWAGARAGKKPLLIIGVVQDVRFMSPREAVSPQFYVYETHGIPDAQAAVRIDAARHDDIMHALQTAWRRVAPAVPFQADTANGRLAEFFRPDQQHARLFSAGAILAILIACLGLYGLASFSTVRRVKEIGIRKVLGARRVDVLWLLVSQFCRPVLAANIIAAPIAYVAMRGFLAGFDQRIGLSPLFFVDACLGSLTIAVLTVLGQAIHVAGADPSKALRHE
jgi:putative ABC transport system permease protein